jgi:hypothetical protein
MNAYQMNAYRTDALVAHAAAAIRRSYPGPQKQYASAAGVTKSTASRHLNGDPHSPAVAYLRAVTIVGYPLIAEGMAALNEVNQRRSIHDLRLIRSRLNEVKHDVDAEEKRHTLRAAIDPTAEQLNAAADADVRVAEICLERAAILRELALRVDHG